MFVASDTGQNDVVLFTTLERIDTGDFDFLVKLLLERSVVLHVVDDVGPLTFVWRDDTNLRGQDTGSEELGDDLFDVARFGSGEIVSYYNV